MNPKKDYSKQYIITVHASEFGWENEVYTSIEGKLEYLWTAILEYSHRCVWDNKSKQYYTPRYPNDESIEMIEIVQNELEKYGLFVAFAFPSKDESYGIDHGSELTRWIEHMKNNPSLISDFILGDESFVSTGNDNGEWDDNDEHCDSYPIIPDWANTAYYYFEKKN